MPKCCPIRYARRCTPYRPAATLASPTTSRRPLALSPSLHSPCTARRTGARTRVCLMNQVGSDLAETLRTGSEHFRRRYSVTVAAENAPILRGVVERTLGMLPGVAREA